MPIKGAECPGDREERMETSGAERRRKNEDLGVLSAQVIEEIIQIQGCGAPKKKWRFEGTGCPSNRGENGDVRARSAEDKFEI